MLQVLRFEAGGEFSGDMIFDELHPPPAAPTIVDPLDMTRRKHFPAGSPSEPLLVPVFREGRRVYDPPPLAETRRRTTDQLARFHEGVKRFVNPHRYPVGLEFGLHERKTALILRARGEAQA
jgi:nicotinate phosphoribosyltransferase